MQANEEMGVPLGMRLYQVSEICVHSFRPVPYPRVTVS